MEAIINLTSIGLAFADITVDWCKKISNDSAVSQTGMTLVERGRGIYKLTNPNITEDTDCYVYETAIPANFAVAIFSPADGNFVKFYENLFDLIESQRGAHTGANMYHIGPTNGDDANDGLTRATAKKTWAGVFALCSNRAHDIIMVHADNPAGQTVWAENIDTTGKAYTFIRGPGRDLLIKPTTTNAPSVLLGAVGCEISGAVIETADNGSETALKMTADFCKGHHFFVDYSRGHGVEIAGCSNSRAHDFLVQTAAAGGSGHAVVIDGSVAATERNLVYNSKLLNNAGDGVRLKGANAKNNFIFGNGEGTIIHDNTGYGINEIDGADHNVVLGPGIHIGDNSSGDVNLTGENSYAENWQPWAKNTDMQTALAKIVLIPTNPVTVLSATGYVKDIYWASGGMFEVKESEDINIPFGFEGNPTGLEIWFVITKDRKNTPVLKKKLIEGTDWDVVPVDGVDTVVGTLPFVYDDTNTLHGEYAAAAIVKTAADKSATGWEATLIVSRPVAKAVVLV